MGALSLKWQMHLVVPVEAAAIALHGCQEATNNEIFN